MACNAVAAVAQSYKSLLVNNPKFRKINWPVINFDSSSQLNKKRTYSIKGNVISLFTIQGRIIVPMKLGEFREKLPRYRHPERSRADLPQGKVFLQPGIDLPKVLEKLSARSPALIFGENNIAAISTGKLFGGGNLRHDRDKFLALEKQLQRNGSQSARQLLKSLRPRSPALKRQPRGQQGYCCGRQSSGCSTITMEDLTKTSCANGSRPVSVYAPVCTAGRQRLNYFVSYKAEAAGIGVEFVNLAYTSQTCSVCGSPGNRVQHRFSCTCGSLAHSDLNASRSEAWRDHCIRRLYKFADVGTASVP